MRPIIGILAEVDDELVCKVQNSYISAIERSGGIPILFPYVESNNTMKDFVQICDGLLFTGNDVSATFTKAAQDFFTEYLGSLVAHKGNMCKRIIKR